MPYLGNSPTEVYLDPVRPHNPSCPTHTRYHGQQVWAHPVSLVATQGIAVAFSSSGY
jgi:hypothetical protein